MPKCPNCGNKVSINDKFCFACGARLKHAEKQIEGKPVSDRMILEAIETEFRKPEEVAEITCLPLPQIMKRLRELVADDVVIVKNAKYYYAEGKEQLIKQIVKSLDSKPLNIKEISDKFNLSVDDAGNIMNVLVETDRVYKEDEFYYSFKYQKKWYKSILFIIGLIFGIAILLPGIVSFYEDYYAPNYLYGGIALIVGSMIASWAVYKYKHKKQLEEHKISE